MVIQRQNRSGGNRFVLVAQPPENERIDALIAQLRQVIDRLASRLDIAFLQFLLQFCQNFVVCLLPDDDFIAVVLQIQPTPGG